MAKAIINKHIEAGVVPTSDMFVENKEHAKGEIIICNDPKNPTLYILDSNDDVRKVSGGNSEGSAYDDTAIRGLIKENEENIASNSAAIQELKENGGNLTIKEDITVAGLTEPLGAGNYTNDFVITAGTDVVTILQNILCKENYPTGVTETSGSVTASMNNLTLSLNPTSTTVEVGTLFKLTKGKTNGSYTNTTASKITNMLYGYSTSDNDTQEYTGTSITSDATYVETNNIYHIKATLTGFTADNGENATYKQTIPTPQSGTSEASLLETNLGCLIEGDNTIKLFATGSTYSYSINEIPKVYYCSNLKKTNEDKFAEVPYTSGSTNTATKTIERKITGKYKYFMGYSEKTQYNQFDSNSIRALNTKTDWITMNGTTTVVNATAIKSNGKSIVVACPSKYKLATINNGVGADILENFTTKGSHGTVDVKTGDITTAYNVYVYPITNNAVVEFKNVTITKS